MARFSILIAWGDVVRRKQWAYVSNRVRLKGPWAVVLRRPLSISTWPQEIFESDKAVESTALAVQVRLVAIALPVVVQRDTLSPYR